MLVTDLYEEIAATSRREHSKEVKLANKLKPPKPPPQVVMPNTKHGIVNMDAMKMNANSSTSNDGSVMSNNRETVLANYTSSGRVDSNGGTPKNGVRSGNTNPETRGRKITIREQEAGLSLLMRLGTFNDQGAMGDKEGAMGDIKSTTKAPSPMSIASADATVGSDGPADAESLGVMPSNRSIIGAQGVPRTGTGGTDSSNNSVMQFANTFLSDMEGVEAVPVTSLSSSPCPQSSIRSNTDGSEVVADNRIAQQNELPTALAKTFGWQPTTLPRPMLDRTESEKLAIEMMASGAGNRTTPHSNHTAHQKATTTDINRTQSIASIMAMNQSVQDILPYMGHNYTTEKNRNAPVVMANTSSGNAPLPSDREEDLPTRLCAFSLLTECIQHMVWQVVGASMQDAMAERFNPSQEAVVNRNTYVRRSSDDHSVSSRTQMPPPDKNSSLQDLSGSPRGAFQKPSTSSGNPLNTVVGKSVAAPPEQVTSYAKNKPKPKLNHQQLMAVRLTNLKAARIARHMKKKKNVNTNSDDNVHENADGNKDSEDGGRSSIELSPSPGMVEPTSARTNVTTDTGISTLTMSTIGRSPPPGDGFALPSPPNLPPQPSTSYGSTASSPAFTAIGNGIKDEKEKGGDKSRPGGRSKHTDAGCEEDHDSLLQSLMATGHRIATEEPTQLKLLLSRHRKDQASRPPQTSNLNSAVGTAKDVSKSSGRSGMKAEQSNRWNGASTPNSLERALTKAFDLLENPNTEVFEHLKKPESEEEQDDSDAESRSRSTSRNTEYNRMQQSPHYQTKHEMMERDGTVDLDKSSQDHWQHDYGYDNNIANPNPNHVATMTKDSVPNMRVARNEKRARMAESTQQVENRKAHEKGDAKRSRRDYGVVNAGGKK